jgi:hypothetical protein
MLIFHPQSFFLPKNFSSATLPFPRPVKCPSFVLSFKKCSNIGDGLLEEAVLLVVRWGSTSLEPSEELLLLPRLSVLVYPAQRVVECGFAYFMVFVVQDMTRLGLTTSNDHKE